MTDTPEEILEKLKATDKIAGDCLSEMTKRGAGAQSAFTSMQKYTYIMEFQLRLSLDSFEGRMLAIGAPVDEYISKLRELAMQRAEQEWKGILEFRKRKAIGE